MNWPQVDRAGLVGLAAFMVMGLVGLIWTYGYEPVAMAERLQGPSWAHPLGTDWLGRDLLHRLVAGTRGFFVPGLLGVMVCGTIGVVLGAYAGFTPPQDALRSPSTVGRKALYVTQSLVSVLLALPGALPRMVSLVLVCAVFGFDAYLLALGAGIVYAGELGEDVCQRVRQCCRQEFVESAAAAGVPSWQILGHHILWLHVRPLVVRHLFQLWAFVILVETSLSFMPGAFGLQEPDPSWGNMLQGTREAALSGEVWAASVVTVVIVATIVMLAWIGDRLGTERSPGAQR